MWCSKCKLSSIHVKNFDRIICTRGHLLCTGCFEGNLCPICGDKIKQKIKMFVDGTPKIYFLPIDSDNDSDYHQGSSEFQQGTSQGGRTASDGPEYSDEYSNDTVENRSSILQFSSDFENEMREFRRDHSNSVKPEVIDLHPPVKNFLSEDEDDRSSTKLVPNPPSLKGSHSSVCIGSSRNISRFKTKSEESIKVNPENSPTASHIDDTFQKPPIVQDPKELFLKTFYSGRNEDDSFDARSHYYKTMAELNAFRDFIVQSSRSQGDGNRRSNSKLDDTSSEHINRNANLKPHSQKIVDHLKEFRRETRYKPPKKFKVYKNYSETSGNMIITSSNSSQSTIHNSDLDKYVGKLNTISPVEKMDIATEVEEEIPVPPNQIPSPVPSVEKPIKKPAVPQIVDPRAIEIREKLKAEIYSNFENKSTVATNNDSFIEAGTTGDALIVNPTLSSLKSLLKTDQSKLGMESSGNGRTTSGNTQKSVSIQPRTQIMHPFSFFSISCEQKRIEELERAKQEIREKLRNEVYSVFNDTEQKAEIEEEHPNCFIEEYQNYKAGVNTLNTFSDSYAKLAANLNRLKISTQSDINSQSELNLEGLQTEESDGIDTGRTVEFLDQTVRESTQYDFLYDSTITSAGASTACRACVYSGSIDFYKFGPPLKLIPLQTNLNREDNVPTAIYPKSIAEINIDRSPVKCPITACEQFIFISSFSKHIKIDHQKILIESITPGRWRNMFVDPRIDRVGVNKCQMFYLIANKITGLGNSKYRDYLPVMVMSTRVDAQHLFDRNPHRHTNSNSNFLMIWLTGLCVSDVPVYYSLTVWSDYQNRPKKLKHPTTCHLVHSKKLYSIRNDQDHLTLYKSGSALIISEEQCKLLSDYGRNMIELQIFVH